MGTYEFLGILEVYKFLHGRKSQICRAANERIPDSVSTTTQCLIASWVVVRTSLHGPMKIAQVSEILRRRGSILWDQGEPDVILLHVAELGPSVAPYHMPALLPTSLRVAIQYQVITESASS